MAESGGGAAVESFGGGFDISWPVETYMKRLHEFGLYVGRSRGRNGRVYGYSPVLDFAADEHGTDAVRDVLEKVLRDVMMRDYKGEMDSWKKSEIALGRSERRNYLAFYRSYDNYEEVEVRVNGDRLRVRKERSKPESMPLSYMSGIA